MGRYSVARRSILAAVESSILRGNVLVVVLEILSIKLDIALATNSLMIISCDVAGFIEGVVTASFDIRDW